MSVIHIINGSPRKKKSTSQYLISLLTGQLADYQLHFIEDLSFDTIVQGDTLIFVAPVYVDGLPSTMIRFLEQFRDYLQDKSVSINGYCMVNCGFPESKQTRIAIDILGNFCDAVGINWCGGLGIGAGEFLLSSQLLKITSRIKRPIHKGLVALSEAVGKQKPYGVHLCEPRMPKWFFKITATAYWYRVGKKNGLTKKDLIKKLAVE